MDRQDEGDYFETVDPGSLALGMTGIYIIDLAAFTTLLENDAELVADEINEAATDGALTVREYHEAGVTYRWTGDSVTYAMLDTIKETTAKYATDTGATADDFTLNVQMGIAGPQDIADTLSREFGWGGN